MTYEKRGSGDDEYEVKKVKSVSKLEAIKVDAGIAGYAIHGSQEKAPMRLRLIASTSGDAASVAAEIDGI